LVSTAMANGASDNATALVVDLAVEEIAEAA
jgi:serine/threonine protein phosphatase PrpC